MEKKSIEREEDYRNHLSKQEGAEEGIGLCQEQGRFFHSNNREERP